MPRHDGRKPDELRPVTMITGFQPSAHGSVLVKWGDTHVLCAASVEEEVPRHRFGSGGGWLTAEYNMLPGSTRPRKRRRTGGRETEIQRLIGRSLRAAFDLDAFGQRTITVDCDVLSADGGTRVASITGGYVAVKLAIAELMREGAIKKDPTNFSVAAVSVGIVDGEPRLDLPYEEDHRATVDMNLVMTGGGDLIEVQGTGEGGTFSRAEMDRLVDLGWIGVQALGDVQSRALGQ
ncbi:MAG: ribonuclease PH [Myxococcales bacterium]|nr:ribonuclease PH [Myxococcales bacterium]